MRAHLQTGDLIAFITYSMVIIMGFLMIGMLSIMLPRADVAAQRIDEVLETETLDCRPFDLQALSRRRTRRRTRVRARTSLSTT